MPDELNGQLLRMFDDIQRPLADAHFLAQVTVRLQPPGVRATARMALRSIARTVVSGLGTGIVVPLRLRYAAPLGLVAAALSLWASLA
jgi:hypothetical protein